VVKIRLKRMGTTKRPVYRLVVADSRSPRDGRFIEVVGFYDPLPNPAVVRIDEDKVRIWMRRGARPSDSARQLLVQQGILAARPAPARAAAASVAAPAAVSEPAAVESVDATPAADEPVGAGEETANEQTAAEEPGVEETEA